MSLVDRIRANTSVITNIKTDLKNSIISKGVVVTDTDKFSDYANKVEEIPEGLEITGTEKVEGSAMTDLKKGDTIVVLNNEDATYNSRSYLTINTADCWVSPNATIIVQSDGVYRNVNGLLTKMTIDSTEIGTTITYTSFTTNKQYLEYNENTKRMYLITKSSSSSSYTRKVYYCEVDLDNNIIKIRASKQLEGINLVAIPSTEFNTFVWFGTYYTGSGTYSTAHYVYGQLKYEEGNIDLVIVKSGTEVSKDNYPTGVGNYKYVKRPDDNLWFITPYTVIEYTYTRDSERFPTYTYGSTTRYAYSYSGTTVTSNADGSLIITTAPNVSGGEYVNAYSFTGINSYTRLERSSVLDFDTFDYTKIPVDIRMTIDSKYLFMTNHTTGYATGECYFFKNYGGVFKQIGQLSDGFEENYSVLLSASNTLNNTILNISFDTNSDCLVLKKQNATTAKIYNLNAGLTQYLLGKANNQLISNENLRGYGIAPNDINNSNVGEIDLAFELTGSQYTGTVTPKEYTNLLGVANDILEGGNA